MPQEWGGVANSGDCMNPAATDGIEDSALSLRGLVAIGLAVAALLVGRLLALAFGAVLHAGFAW